MVRGLRGTDGVSGGHVKANNWEYGVCCLLRCKKGGETWGARLRGRAAADRDPHCII